MSAMESGWSYASEQETCRLRLAEAEKEYHRALREYAVTVDLRMGEAAIAEAESRKCAARVEYHRVLRMFSDLVVRGKRPKG